ncbi:MAG: hypothetical protein HPY65_07850 [Syntrophaceae bacterium]|nr:hypothetical protein [Syntrophaceae bacterium]
MDDIDQAQQNDEFFRRQALDAYFRRRPNTTPFHGTHSEAGNSGPHPESRGGPEPGAGTDGRICIDCEGEIEPERLKAVPEAVRCIDCQTKLEWRIRHAG